jgi:hypothetical protein
MTVEQELVHGVYVKCQPCALLVAAWHLSRFSGGTRTDMKAHAPRDGVRDLRPLCDQLYDYATTDDDDYTDF